MAKNTKSCEEGNTSPRAGVRQNFEVQWINDNYGIIVRALRRSANITKDKVIKALYENALKTMPDKKTIQNSA